MNKILGMLLVAVMLVPLMAWAGENSQTPITSVGVHMKGPERPGNLPAVIAPPDNPQTTAKIQLGKQLYFDNRLSQDGTVACATCHDPAKGWSDAGPTSTGIRGQIGGRRAPPVSNAAHSPLQFWDGRAPSLEEQAKGPVQNPIEMGNTHDVMVKTLNDVPGYVQEFKDVFGTTPITVDQVAQAIAAYERTVVTTDSPFDRYVRGDQNALTKQEKMGLEIFNGKGHCTACHWGSYFSDGRFHNLGVTQTGPNKTDNGRYDVTKNPADKGAFKTPTVRDAALRAPYMHTGGEKTLEDVVNFYNRGGGDNKETLDPLMVPLGLSKSEAAALVAFLKVSITSLNPEIRDAKPIPQSEMPK